MMMTIMTVMMVMMVMAVMMTWQIYDVGQLKLRWFSFLSLWRRLKLIKLILTVSTMTLRVKTLSIRMMMQIFSSWGHAG